MIITDFLGNRLYSVSLNEDEYSLFSESEQREFTRADRQALLELYRKTNGLRSVANSYKNLDARDLARFRKMAYKADGDIFRVDRKEAKYLLDKMGLSKTSKNLDHLLDKYSPERYKELFDRANRIKSSVQSTDKLVESRNLKKGKIRDRVDSKRTKLAEQFRERAGKKEDQLDRLLDYAKERSKRFKNSDEVYQQYEDKLYKSLDKYYKKEYNKYHNLREKLSKREQRSLDKISDEYNEKIKKIEESNDRKLQPGRQRNNDFLEKLQNQIKERQSYYINRLNHNYSSPLSVEDAALRKKILESVQKRRGVAFEFSPENIESYDRLEKKIRLKPNSSPFAAGHEAGHADDLLSGNPTQFRNNPYSANIAVLSKEAVASARGISRGKILGATDQQVNKGKQELEDAFNTYHGVYLNNLLEKYKASSSLSKRIKPGLSQKP